jgi:hypothetical protein
MTLRLEHGLKYVDNIIFKIYVNNDKLIREMCTADGNVNTPASIYHHMKFVLMDNY